MMHSKYYSLKAQLEYVIITDFSELRAEKKKKTFAFVPWNLIKATSLIFAFGSIAYTFHCRNV